MRNRPASNGVKNELGGYEFQSTLMMSERHFHYAIVAWEKVGTFFFKKNKWLGIVLFCFVFFYSLATDARLFQYWALPVKRGIVVLQGNVSERSSFLRQRVSVPYVQQSRVSGLHS